MPKAITVPPALNTANIPREGAEVLIKEVRELVDQKTTLGVTKKGIAMTIEYDKAIYSQMFTLDNAIIAGSAGRILNSIGIEDTEAKDFSAKIQTLVGKKIRVMQREGKIYWYPEIPKPKSA